MVEYWRDGKKLSWLSWKLEMKKIKDDWIKKNNVNLVWSQEVCLQDQFLENTSFETKHVHVVRICPFFTS